ncbi:MAG: transporter substrate-binding domain-containing protein [Clostridia bacterium]|nr:transporter substrate-binding domain-containing protein [Clostridia bacterium]
MKKILAITLCAVMLLTSVLAFASCGETKAKVEVFTEYELTAESYAFAIAKGNDELKTAANDLLAELSETGELNKIINSFFDGTATFAYTNPVSTVPTGADKENYLVVATNAYFPPFEYYEGSKLSGVDMKIASLLADKLGKTLYINDMDFDTIITSVMNGESDIGMAGMTVNETRLELVDFTTEYYESAQVLIAREDDSVFADCKSAEDIENVLKKQGKDFIVGTQNGTTGFMYTAGDADFGYDGYKNLETKSYTTGALAVLDLANGKINAVIIDKQPAIMIAESTNK